MTTEDHIHDCTGPTMTCPCGYVFTVPPVCISVEVSYRGRTLVSDGFNCDTISGAIAGLEEAIRKLDKTRI